MSRRAEPRAKASFIVKVSGVMLQYLNINGDKYKQLFPWKVIIFLRQNSKNAQQSSFAQLCALVAAADHTSAQPSPIRDNKVSGSEVLRAISTELKVGENACPRRAGAPRRRRRRRVIPQPGFVSRRLTFIAACIAK
ncbi:hypothetical protein EVAR_32584_1 [Eumeta japonica]|uniref:Uncharacterized protein n=1 Tax=Eumeta variegata TaxID=151549 RepID=A0A4C1VR42_EUMVA|nr:hypothetical protein EVAR_32584_1 [Eumeta japonica]